MVRCPRHNLKKTCRRQLAKPRLDAFVVDERLPFEGVNSRYHAVHASEHFSRYQLLRRKCEGRRVLDAACGEGFGCFLLAEWGAKEVVGIDIAEQAITRARQLFQHERVTFYQHDLENVDVLFQGEPPFEVVGCFETIEHLKNPGRFLKALQRIVRPDALIVITCPNDHCSLAPWQSNPYHLAQYTFEEFKQLTTGQLGEARQWLFGTSLNGTAALGISTNELQPATEMRELMRAAVLDDAALLPPQANIAPTPEDCLYFAGVWGGTVPAGAAISPASHSSFIEPWRKIDRLEREQAESSAVLARLREQVAGFEAQKVAAAAQQAAATAELARVQKALERERQGRQSDLRRAQARARALFTEQRQAAQAINSFTVERIRIKAEAYAQEELSRKEIQQLKVQVAGLRAGLDYERMQVAGLRTALDYERMQVAGLRAALDYERMQVAGLRAALDYERAQVAGLRAALNSERMQLAPYRGIPPTYRWLLGHLRRRALGSPVPILPIDAGPPNLQVHTPPPADEERLLIEASGLFDHAWYMARNPDIVGIDALEHYRNHGWRERRRPGPAFDTEWYLLHNPDVAELGINPLVHYIRYGIAQGRSPAPPAPPADEERLLIEASGLFDHAWYMACNPDTVGIDALEHYRNHGWRERRRPGPAFDTEWYLLHNPDVAELGINPLVHYIRYGIAEGRSPAPPADEERLLIEASGLFDHAWYMARNPDIVGIDALEHYRNHGWRERRRPGPAFDTEWYLLHNPDVAELGINPLVHYIRHGIAQGRSLAPNPSAASAAEQLIRDVSAFEPDIANVADFKDVSRLPFRSAVYPSALLQAWGKLFASLTSQFSHVIFLPWLVRGGADLIAMNAARAAIEQHGPAATLVVVTDHDRLEAADWLPLAAEIRVISDYAPNLSHEDRVRIVEMLILSMRPRAVLNVNSRACWDAIQHKGLALSQFTRLYGALFCRDYSEDSRAAGYSDTHFRTCLPNYTKVYFDNKAFRRELIQDYGLPASIQERLSVAYAPPMDGLRSRGFRRGDTGGRLPVLWAGRFCRQKNIDLLIEIAQKAPHLQFDVYGGGDAAYTSQLMQAEHRLPNLSLRGFPSLEGISTDLYGAFLFTSLWEGLPTVLINIGALGLPIVASDVGGVSELVSSETGWLIQNHTQPEPYLAALDEIQRAPDEAALRAKSMAALVEEQHSWKAYIQAFSSSPSFLD